MLSSFLLVHIQNCLTTPTLFRWTLPVFETVSFDSYNRPEIKNDVTGDGKYCLTFIWDLRLSLRAQRKGHKGHWWLFKPVWMTMCLFQ